VSGERIIPASTDIPVSALRNLRQMGITLECAAASFTGAVQRVESGQASFIDFERATEAHGFARDNFRVALEEVTGLSAAAIERWLAL
jgi:hypothetical protein